MQKTIPLWSITRHCCILLLLCSSCFSAFTQTVYVSPSGDDAAGDGSSGNPYRTITQGIAMAAPGNIIQLAGGTYDELVVIDKSVTIDGVDTNLVTATYTGTISNYGNTGTVLPTLFKVTAQDVVIRNIRFIVNLNIVHSAIHTSGNASGLQVLNNSVRASANGTVSSIPAALALIYTRMNAIVINPGINYGASKYTQVPSGLTNIKVAGNFVSGTTAAMNGVIDANFRAAIYADNVGDLTVGGTVGERNILQTINHDIIIRFIMGGDITIRNNEFNGGGVELSTTNVGTGTMLIDSNYFNYLPPIVPDFALLRLMNNTAGKSTVIRGNTFYNQNWFINLGNYNTVLADSNIFTPVIKDAVANNDFRLITVNTKPIQTSASPKVTMSGTFTRNEFNGAAGADGTAVAFYNHDAGTLSTYTVGEAGAENVFNANISHFFHVDNSNGQGTTSMTGAYPEYSGIYNSTTGWWTQTIMASQNFFDIGAGSLLKPGLMDAAQRATIDGMITDQLDDANIGLVDLYSTMLAYHPRPTPVRNGEEYDIPFQVYPNPVVTGVNVQVNTRKKQPVQLRVFNMHGVCLKVLQANSSNIIQVNMAGWSAGIYLIEIVTPAGSNVRQVIKK